MLDKIRILLAKLMALTQQKTLLEKFCDAIQEFEGWNTTSRSFRNKNPGNLKYTSLTKELGAVSCDVNNYAIFKNEESGYNALNYFVRLACENKLKDYKSNMTIWQFFIVYAPSRDNNNPLKYALFVAKETGLDINDKIIELL